MTCKFCEIPVGVEGQVGGAHTICDCGIDIGFMFRGKRATHMGKLSTNKHFFKLDKPVFCPKCGQRTDTITVDCEDDGYYVELPILIQLPIDERIER